MYEDRQMAGRALARRLASFGGRDVVVLGLLRGGIPVAAEVAKELRAPLYPLLPRKIGAPSDPELAIGAVAQDGTIVLNQELVELLSVPRRFIDAATEKERQLTERRLARLGALAVLPDLAGKTVILVDDGIATGHNMLAAVASVRKSGPERIIVAAPVAPRETLQQFAGVADETIVLATPYPFFAVGQFYSDFSPVSDDEVEAILVEHASRLEGHHRPDSGRPGGE